MAKKMRKTLYLPEWIVELLEIEGKKYEGPGVVAAASIYNFIIQKDEQKKTTLKSYLSTDIDKSFAVDTVAGSEVREKEIHKKKDEKKPKAG